MQTNNGVKQRFLDCFLKLLDKKRKKWRELLLDQYVCWSLLVPFLNLGTNLFITQTGHCIWKLVKRKHIKFEK